ncbi:RipA family octameric membrane protein [Shouchella miscanthi]|uniref:RipA family octameric membrane protein n=1 Tax=Shouchella miscanthi TaxID=2598861 RepID=UPI0011A2F5D8|nr:hypothetical protein [Shouchella miscanthi]
MNENDKSKSTTINQDDYLDKFDKKRKMMALNYALDIRKFEIELYWKRATYFWTFLAATFAGYFLLVSSERDMSSSIYVVILSCIGSVFAYSWWKVNEGSKTWQDNWERQVDLFEDDVLGLLYKSLIIKNNTPKFYSVSKINLNLSKNIFRIWLGLVIVHSILFIVDKIYRFNSPPPDLPPDFIHEFTTITIVESFLLVIAFISLKIIIKIIDSSTNSSHDLTNKGEDENYTVYLRENGK